MKKKKGKMVILMNKAEKRKLWEIIPMAIPIFIFLVIFVVASFLHGTRMGIDFIAANAFPYP